MKEKLAEAVRPRVAAWAGVHQDSLKITEVSGLRLYRKGSSLFRHVDTQKTHALTAEVEVGYLFYGRPSDEIDGDRPRWSLAIEARNGTELLIPNEVGQLIMYESAT